MMYAPNILNTGKNAGMAKNIRSDALKLRSERGNIESPPFLHTIISNIINITSKKIRRENVDSGVSQPTLSNTLFSSRPENIKNAILNPTSSTNFSVNPILFGFNICRINNPGKMIRKRNPDICLRSGISKNIVKFVMRIIDVTTHPVHPNFNVKLLK